MSPRLEARQLQVEKGQVYSVQSHSLKTGVSEWKLEKKGGGMEKASGQWPRIKWSSKCFKTTSQRVGHDSKTELNCRRKVE